MSGRRQSRVLVLGDDMRIFLAVVRSLGRAGHEVHVAPGQSRSPALASRYIGQVHDLPQYSDDPQAWISGLLAILSVHSIDLVIPCCDSFALPLHAHRRDLAAFRVAIPNERVMTELYDKDLTRRLAGSLGVPVAPGAVLCQEDTAEDLAARFGLPLVIKPRQSFWIDRLETWGKVHILDTVEDLRGQLGEIPDPTRYLVECFFPSGVGVGVSVLAKDGRILQSFQHRRLREGRGTSSSYRVSEPVRDELLDACASLCRATKLTGVCMFEFRCNPQDGSWILLETNARLWGSLPLPVSLGVDFPLYLHDLLVSGAEPEPVDYAAGVRSRNLVLDAHNLLSSARPLRSIGPGFLAGAGDFLLQPLRWITGQERCDSFVADDPRPGFAELASLGRLWTRVPGREGKIEQRHRAGSEALSEKLPRAA